MLAITATLTIHVGANTEIQKGNKKPQVKLVGKEQTIFIPLNMHY